MTTPTAHALSTAKTIATLRETIPASAQSNFHAFTFGDPEPVIGRRDFMSLLESRFNGRWYEPPIPMDGLTRAFNASPHHSSAIYLKRNLLVRNFTSPGSKLSRRAFSGFVTDYLTLGNAYLEAVPNRIGGRAGLDHVLGKYMRRGKDGTYFQVTGHKQEHEFAPGAIVHVYQPSLDQEVYGVPEYISALQSAFLNENATLFRRKYYLNGSHAGFILHLNGQFSDQDMDHLRKQLDKAKGLGNFKNLLMQSDGQEKDSIKLIPISEVAAKDEFLGIKNTTRDDILAAHRTPPQLIGVVPTNAGGFGPIDKAMGAFIELEILPLQMQLLDMNDQLGEEVIGFAPFVPAIEPSAAA